MACNFLLPENIPIQIAKKNKLPEERPLLRPQQIEEPEIVESSEDEYVVTRNLEGEEDESGEGVHRSEETDLIGNESMAEEEGNTDTDQGETDMGDGGRDDSPVSNNGSQASSSDSGSESDSSDADSHVVRRSNRNKSRPTIFTYEKVGGKPSYVRR